jgi:hypothetical protein
MNMRKLSAFCIASSVALAACSAGQPTQAAASSGTPASASGSWVDGMVDHVLDEANTKLTTGNITVSHNDENLPKAEITPQGDFLVGGKPVSLTPAQRAEVLAYRQQIIQIGKQGIAVGKQGAALGMQAAGTALAAAFSGKSDKEIQRQVEAKTAGIRQAAAKICNRLPALKDEQQKLASVLPAFKPYATMTQQDIDDCHTDALNDGDDD